MVGLGLAATAQEHKRVLWIGNSYTDVNNLPLLTQKIAESMGDRLEYESNTPGGCTFAGHCQNNSMDLIQRGGWDIVVLQGQSQEPSFPQEQVERETFPYAQQLVEAVYRSNGSTVEPMFYMTWGRKNGDRYNAQFYPPLATYEGMDSLLYERYMYMGRTYNASVCPVGRVWHYIRDNYRDIELYQSDDSHPSMEGSYAAACAFYVMFFEKDPSRIAFEEGVQSENARIIREVVKTVVYDSLAEWKREGWVPPTPPVGIETAASQPTMFAGPYVLYNIVGQPVWKGNDPNECNPQHMDLPKGLYIMRSVTSGVGKKVVKY